MTVSEERHPVFVTALQTTSCEKNPFSSSLADIGRIEAIWFNILQRNGDTRSDHTQSSVLCLVIKRYGINCTKA